MLVPSGSVSVSALVEVLLAMRRVQTAFKVVVCFFCIVTTNLGITPGALTWDVFVYSVMGIKVQRPRCFFDISINNVLGNTKKTHIAQHLKQVSLTPV